MKTTVTIPQTIQEQKIVEFRINPAAKRFVTVVIEEGGQQKKIIVDVANILKNATATQKTVLLTFFKQIAVDALEQYNDDSAIAITTADIEGDIFTEEQEQI